MNVSIYCILPLVLKNLNQWLCITIEKCVCVCMLYDTIKMHYTVLHVIFVKLKQKQN